MLAEDKATNQVFSVECLSQPLYSVALFNNSKTVCELLGSLSSFRSILPFYSIASRHSPIKEKYRWTIALAVIKQDFDMWSKEEEQE